MGFNEANAVRDAIRDYLVPLGWKFVSRTQLQRAENEVFVLKDLVEALIRLNPEIAEKPDRAARIETGSDPGAFFAEACSPFSREPARAGSGACPRARHLRIPGV